MAHDALSTWVAEPDLNQGPGSAPLVYVAGETALVVTESYGASTYRHQASAWSPQAGSHAVGSCGELNGPASTHYAGAISENAALVSSNHVTGHFGPCVYLRSGDEFVAAPPLEADDETGDLSAQFAIAGSTVLIAASAGIAVYERTGDAFTHMQMLSTSDGLTGSKPFWIAGDDAIVQSAGVLFAFERGVSGWIETGAIDTASTTPVSGVALGGGWLLVQSGASTGFYSKLDHVWSFQQLVASPRGVMSAGRDVAVIDSVVYESIDGSWQRTFDLNPTVISEHLQPPFRRPVTSVAVWDGGVLLALNGTYLYDGLTFRELGPVKPFDRYIEPPTCSANADCASAHCVEGICCQTACTGTCVSCLASRKGSGVDGVCGFVADSSDPRDSCDADGLDGCGQTGLCTSQGTCAVQSDGTPCSGGYVCEQGACGTTCDDDAGCDAVNGYSCVDGYCRESMSDEPMPGGDEPTPGGAGGEASEPAGAGGGPNEVGGAANEPALPSAGASGLADAAGSSSEPAGRGGSSGLVSAQGLARQRPRVRHQRRLGGCTLAGAPPLTLDWATLAALLALTNYRRRRR